MNNLEKLLEEAFHTYQLYLQCTNALTDNQAKIPLLKWPDVAQSALKYALALEQNQDTTAIKQTMLEDLRIATVEPIAVVYRSTRTRVKNLLEKEPATKVEPEVDPIEYKNNLINALNELFATLETMTGVEYPRLNKRLITLRKGSY